MKPELLYDLLNRALEEELGMVISTNNPQRMSLDLHNLTRDMPKYASLTITVPSTPDTVMIVKKTVELDEPIGDFEDV
jgi:hypothetical protein